MKNYFFIAVLLFAVLIAPAIVSAERPTYNPSQGLVPCGKAANGSDACTLCDFFKMLAIIYDFIVKWIATPLAVLALTIGAIFMMVSAGNPQMQSRGRQILWVAIIGLALVWCSWLIINFIITSLGYQGNWSSINCT